MYVFKVHDSFFLPDRACELELTLQIGSGLILVGENGLGKSTLLNRIYHQATPRASLVIQAQPDYFYDRRLLNFKDLFLEASRGVINEARFRDLWELFAFCNKESRFISQLSGGEKQMLKLILGLSPDRELYLLDEPSQFLDKAGKEKLAEVLAKLLSEGKSLLVVEHNPGWIDSDLPVLSLELRDNVIRRAL